MQPHLRTRPARRLLPAVAAFAIGLMALAACSAVADSESGAPAAGGAGGDAVAEQPNLGNVPAEGVAPNGNPAAPMAPVDERSLIYTGTITVRVESVVQAADRAIALAVGSGGIVAGDSRTIEESGAQATLALRVPADEFQSTLDSLAALGTEEERRVTAEDVTEKLIDLDARIATQQASVNRVRELLARAQTIAEIVALESELTRRQADLDSLLQRRATMSGLVELATITVVLFGRSGPIEPEEEETGFLAGLKGGWQGFLASVTIVLTVAGWLLPWALAIGGPLGLLAWVLRRRRRRATAVPQ